MVKARGWMHELYKVARAPDNIVLFGDFNKSTPSPADAAGSRHAGRV